MYTLTSLTGRRAGDNRTVAIKTFEMKHATAMALRITIPVFIVVGLVLAPLLSLVAIPVAVVVAGVVHWAITARSRDGMQLRAYQAAADRRRSEAGIFYMAGRVIDPFQAEVGVLRRNTVDVPGREVVALDVETPEPPREMAPAIEPAITAVQPKVHRAPKVRAGRGLRPARTAKVTRAQHAHSGAPDPWTNTATANATPGATSSW